MGRRVQHAHDKSFGDNSAQLKVWGNVTEPSAGLIGGLATYGWRPERCGWPQAGSGHDAGKPPAHLVVVDDGAPSQLVRLQPMLSSSGAEWVFLCSPQAMERDDVRAMLACCAYAYQCLPGDALGLDTMLHQAQSMAALRAAITAVGVADRAANDSVENEMVGRSPAMLGLFDAIRKVAVVDAPVLIRGESGTGKELAAQAIHERSSRAEGPFIAVNCAALPPELVQSELFGYEKGAFTGATRRQTGHVEAADGGTLLLDEIGDLPLALQVHLLRFLQSGKIQRVGSSAETPVNVRVLAATHVPLEQAVRSGQFREDLYHRLDVVSLRVPPLRERVGDIETLARFFFDRFAAERTAGIRGISQDALQQMCQYDWPGNVRELINRMRRAMVMGEGRLISAADLGLDNAASGPQILTLEAARAQAESEQIVAALCRNRHRVAAAARELGVSRVTLYRLMDKHQLQRPAEPPFTFS